MGGLLELLGGNLQTLLGTLQLILEQGHAAVEGGDLGFGLKRDRVRANNSPLGFIGGLRGFFQFRCGGLQAVFRAF